MNLAHAEVHEISGVLGRCDVMIHELRDRCDKLEFYGADCAAGARVPAWESAEKEVYALTRGIRFSHEFLESPPIRSREEKFILVTRCFGIIKVMLTRKEGQPRRRQGR